jgi:hypothetical protein
MLVNGLIARDNRQKLLKQARRRASRLRIT